MSIPPKKNPANLIEERAGRIAYLPRYRYVPATTLPRASAMRRSVVEGDAVGVGLKAKVTPLFRPILVPATTSTWRVEDLRGLCIPPKELCNKKSSARKSSVLPVHADLFFGCCDGEV